jgi:hypothetical protein
MRQFIIDVLFITAIVYAMLWLALYQWDVDEMVEPTTFYDGVEIQPNTYRYVPQTITTECGPGDCQPVTFYDKYNEETGQYDR